ncbi:metallophosphoesterase [Haloimpatiens lingqiaonensis]|uniref:metallophosphoesterase n=1 Tax=Haloimpatiens lingqiaonensis TaxID=1380675 RepID=UPI0010FD5917|nr:metallophosphoesterase [Haloimpatiens lingqiaonensis]
MRIGIISDTHRDLTCISKLEDVFKEIDMIIHLGDNVRDVEELSSHFKCPFINVKGNCDFTNKVPDEIVEEIGGKRFLITHGHKYDVKWGIDRLRYRALELQADIVLFGHTHCSMNQYIDNTWYVNPGSPSLPRDSSKTVGIIRIEGEQVDVSIMGIN